MKKVILAVLSANPLPIIQGAKLLHFSSDSEGLPTVLIGSFHLWNAHCSTQGSQWRKVKFMTDELTNYIFQIWIRRLTRR